MNWFELRDRVLSLPTLEKKSKHLGDEILESEAQIATLLSTYESTKHDVARLSAESFSSFLKKIIGTHERKLEKKQIAELDAKLEYDNLLNHLEHLKDEKKNLDLRISELQADEVAYLLELRNRRAKLSSQLSESEIKKHSAINNEYAKIIEQITQIEECLAVASDAEKSTRRVIKLLNNAEVWTLIDTVFRSGFGGGIISHFPKFSQIDKAEKALLDLAHYIRVFKTELNALHDLDIHSLANITQVSSFERVFSLLSNHWFARAQIMDKILSNAQMVGEAQDSIRHIRSLLKKELAKLKTKLKANRDEESEFLISHNFNIS